MGEQEIYKKLTDAYPSMRINAKPIRYRWRLIFECEFTPGGKWQIVTSEDPKQCGYTILGGADYNKFRKYINTEILFEEFRRDRALFKQWFLVVCWSCVSASFVCACPAAS